MQALQKKVRLLQGKGHDITEGKLVKGNHRQQMGCRRLQMRHKRLLQGKGVTEQRTVAMMTFEGSLQVAKGAP